MVQYFCAALPCPDHLFVNTILPCKYGSWRYDADIKGAPFLVMVALNRHLGTITQLCRTISSQLRHLSTIGKKLVKQQYVLHMSPQYGELGPLAAEVGLPVWGTPANFNGFRVLAALLHRSQVVSVSQTLRH